MERRTNRMMWPKTNLSFVSDRDKNEFKKMVLLSTCFFFSIVAFSIIKPLKQSIFLGFIGKGYQPLTRYLTLILLAPVMFFYSKLVDKLRRYQLVAYIMMSYGILSLIFAYFLLHPVYGLANTEQSVWRLLGWAIYLYGDFFQIFVIGSFWSFANSITDPQHAKKNYGKMVAVSKVAGLLTGILCYLTIENPQIRNTQYIIPLFISFVAIAMCLAALSILYIKWKIPGQYLHGYESVYQMEKQKGEEKTGILEGIRLMVTQPYVFGIFGLLFSHEIISAIADFQMLSLVETYYNSKITDMSSFFFLYTAAFQGLGLFFAYFGTTFTLKYFDVRKSLLISPLISAILMMFLAYNPTLITVTIVMVVLRAVNYGFNVPIREILYIPTVKDIKFKAKAWTDSFGRTFSKVSGSTFNWLFKDYAISTMMVTGSAFSLVVTAIWATIAVFVGRKYDKTIADGVVISGTKQSNT